jgi:hypothetical protein
LWFNSCLTVKKIESNCDKFAKICATTATVTELHDTTIYVEKPVYIDKIIRVPIPGRTDTLRITDTVRIVNNQAYMKPIHKQIGIIGVDASMHKSVFEIAAYLTDSSILYNYIDTLTFADSLTIYNAIRTTTTEATITLQPKKYIPKIYKITFWIVIAQLLAIAAIVLGPMGFFYRIRNFFKKK